MTGSGEVDASEADSRPDGTRRLRVGVTGHRPDRLPTSTTAYVRVQLARVLRAIARLDELGRPIVVISLAEGADRIAASVATEAGLPVRVVLPFPREEFARDFAGEHSVAEYRTLLERAVEVIELPGSRSTAADPYMDAGDELLTRSDVLVAIWDGGAPRGPGGTPDLVERALERGLPVVWIPLAPESPVRVLVTRAGERRSEPIARLPELLAEP